MRAGLADAVQAPRACAAACPPIVIALAGVCLSMKQAEGYVKMPSTEPPVPSNVARDSVRRYLVVADRATGESAFSITFPAFPGLTSVALCDADIESQARDALATVAEAFLEDARPCCRASKAMHCRLSTESAFTTRGGFSWLSRRGNAGENLPPICGHSADIFRTTFAAP